MITVILWFTNFHFRFGVSYSLRYCMAIQFDHVGFPVKFSDRFFTVTNFQTPSSVLRRTSESLDPHPSRLPLWMAILFGRALGEAKIDDLQMLRVLMKRGPKHGFLLFVSWPKILELQDFFLAMAMMIYRDIPLEVINSPTWTQGEDSSWQGVDRFAAKNGVLKSSLFFGQLRFRWSNIIVIHCVCQTPASYIFLQPFQGSITSVCYWKIPIDVETQYPPRESCSFTPSVLL